MTAPATAAPGETAATIADKWRTYENAKRRENRVEKEAAPTLSTPLLEALERAEDETTAAWKAWHFATTGGPMPELREPEPCHGWTDHDERALRSNGSDY